MHLHANELSTKSHNNKQKPSSKTVTSEAFSINNSHQERIAVGKIKNAPKRIAKQSFLGRKKNYKPQNQNETIHCKDDSSYASPVCARRIKVHPCIIPPCPFDEVWINYGSAKEACNALGIYEYVFGKCFNINRYGETLQERESE